MKSGLPFLLMFAVSCSAPTEYARDNPKDPAGEDFEFPNFEGLTSTRVDRHIRLAWNTPFTLYTIYIEKSLNGGPFTITDSIKTGDNAWIDDSVTLPDSIIYQYRVYGRYLNHYSDTLTSYRITSAVNMHSITQEFLDGRPTVRFSPWSAPATTVVLTGDLQTFHLNVDSVSVSLLFEDGSRRYLRRLTQSTFPNPLETQAVKFVVTQYIRGRDIQVWTSRSLDSGHDVSHSLIESIGGHFAAGFPYFYSSGSTQTFISNFLSSNLTALYVPHSPVVSFMERDLDDPMVSTANVTSNRIVYSTQSGKVRSRILTMAQGTHMNVPGPATNVGAYYETGEIVYVRAQSDQPTLASIDRFNVFTQTLISSFPIESTTPKQVLDRPELNEIWVFHRGLMRLNRTTGAVLKDFESDEPINSIVIRNGKAYASFQNNAPYVAIYDLETGTASILQIPFTYNDSMFLTDGIHIVFRQASIIRVFNLTLNKVIATSESFGPMVPVGFLPVHESTLNDFIFVFMDGSINRVIEFHLGTIHYFFRADE